jgi:hypothetical protein
MYTCIQVRCVSIFFMFFSRKSFTEWMYVDVHVSMHEWMHVCLFIHVHKFCSSRTSCGVWCEHIMLDRSFVCAHTCIYVSMYICVVCMGIRGMSWISAQVRRQPCTHTRIYTHLHCHHAHKRMFKSHAHANSKEEQSRKSHHLEVLLRSLHVTLFLVWNSAPVQRLWCKKKKASGTAVRSQGAAGMQSTVRKCVATQVCWVYCSRIEVACWVDPIASPFHSSGRGSEPASSIGSPWGTLLHNIRVHYWHAWASLKILKNWFEKWCFEAHRDGKRPVLGWWGIAVLWVKDLLQGLLLVCWCPWQTCTPAQWRQFLVPRKWHAREIIWPCMDVRQSGYLCPCWPALDIFVPWNTFPLLLGNLLFWKANFLMSQKL